MSGKQQKEITKLDFKLSDAKRIDEPVQLQAAEEDICMYKDAEVEGFEADEELDAELYGLTGGAGAEEFGAEAPAPELQA
eukprot:tig00000459_g1127.t1